MSLLSLVLASGLAAQSIPGYLARGTATVTTSWGELSGTISVAFAAPDRCKVELDLGSPVRPREVVAVFNGATGGVRGPAVLLHAAPIPFGPPAGCALLAPRPDAAATWAKLKLVAVPGTARPASLTWQLGNRVLTVSYTYASPGAALPASVTESVDGAVRLTVTYATITPQTFAAGEFTAPVGGAQ